MDTNLHIAPDLALPLESVTQTFAILAKRGAGKTYTASVLVEEMLAAGAQVVVIIQDSPETIAARNEIRERGSETQQLHEDLGWDFDAFIPVLKSFRDYVTRDWLGGASRSGGTGPADTTGYQAGASVAGLGCTSYERAGPVPWRAPDPADPSLPPSIGPNAATGGHAARLHRLRRHVPTYLGVLTPQRADRGRRPRGASPHPPFIGVRTR